MVLSEVTGEGEGSKLDPKAEDEALRKEEARKEEEAKAAEVAHKGEEKTDVSSAHAPKVQAPPVRARRLGDRRQGHGEG